MKRKQARISNLLPCSLLLNRGDHLCGQFFDVFRVGEFVEPLDGDGLFHVAGVFQADGQVLQDGVVLAGFGDFLKRGDQLILCEAGADFRSGRGIAAAPDEGECQ